MPQTYRLAVGANSESVIKIHSAQFLPTPSTCCTCSGQLCQLRRSLGVHPADSHAPRPPRCHRRAARFAANLAPACPGRRQHPLRIPCRSLQPQSHHRFRNCLLEPGYIGGRLRRPVPLFFNPARPRVGGRSPPPPPPPTPGVRGPSPPNPRPPPRPFFTRPSGRGRPARRCC